MKPITTVYAITILFLVSCKEKQNVIPYNKISDSTTVDSASIEDTTYAIFGVTDFIVPQLSKRTFTLNVVYLDGTQQKINVQALNLPDGITATLTPSTGYASFNTDILFKTIAPKPGRYPIIVKGISETHKSKTYHIDLIVEKTSCDSFLYYHADRFITKEVGKPYIIHNTSYISFGTVPHTTIFSDLFCRFDGSEPIIVRTPVNAIIDCDKQTIIIPDTTVGAFNNRTNMYEYYTISGTGNINYEKQKVFVQYSAKRTSASTKYFEMESDIDF